jgi:putative copper export protein
MGGMIVTVVSFIPALKNALGPGIHAKKVMLAFQKRQSKWVYISMGGLILTGLMMNRRSPEFQHLFSFQNIYSITLSIKHILVILMIGITLYRSLIFSRKQTGPLPMKDKLGYQLIKINAMLAITILLLSGLVASFANPYAGG